MRITKDQYYLGIAKAVSKRSSCIRRQYGAVIVKDDRIVSTGYNGSARGEINCCDVGICHREGLPHNTSYNSDCPAVHAEENAIMQAGREAIGSTLYLAGFDNEGNELEAVPCIMCRRKIKNAQIKNIINNKGEIKS